MAQSATTNPATAAGGKLKDKTRAAVTMAFSR